MELEEFIKTTLVNIKKGVNSANVELAKMEGKELGKDAGAIFVINPGKENNISFDIAVTTAKGTSGGGKIRVAVVNIGGDRSNSEEYVSRIKFLVNSHTSIS